jgi:hypothetical protein
MTRAARHDLNKQQIGAAFMPRLLNNCRSTHEAGGVQSKRRPYFIYFSVDSS